MVISIEPHYNSLNAAADPYIVNFSLRIGEYRVKVVKLKKKYCPPLYPHRIPNAQEYWIYFLR